MSSYAEIGRRIALRFDPRLLSDLSRGQDRALDTVRQIVEAPEAAHALISQLFGAPLHRRPALLHMAGFGEFGAPAPQSQPDLSYSPGAPQAPLPPPQVKRLPFVLWAGTALTASQASVAADPADYTNSTPFPLVVTHVTLSESVEPVISNPSFRLSIAPGDASRPWTANGVRVPAGVLCTYQPYGPVQNGVALPTAHWKLAAPYQHKRARSLYVAASSEIAAAAQRVSVAAIGFRRDAQGTPRIFWDEQSLAAGATAESPFNGTNFRADADVDVDLTDIIVTAGHGTWGVPNQGSPSILIRPSEGGSDWMARLTSAIHLNNTPGGLGAYWELRVPQRIGSGQTISVTLDEMRGVARQANVGFLGYLEAPQTQ